MRHRAHPGHTTPEQAYRARLKAHPRGQPSAHFRIRHDTTMATTFSPSIKKGGKPTLCQTDDIVTETLRHRTLLLNLVELLQGLQVTLR